MAFPLESLCEFNIFNYRRERRKKKSEFLFDLVEARASFQPHNLLSIQEEDTCISCCWGQEGEWLWGCISQEMGSVSSGPSLVPRMTWAVPPPYSTCLSLSHLPYLWFNIHLWAYLIAFLLSHNTLSSTKTRTVFAWVQHWIYTGPSEISGQKINDQLMFMKWINDGNKKKKKWSDIKRTFKELRVLVIL